MDDSEASPIVNRDEPIPLLRVNDDDTPAIDEAEDSKGSRAKRAVSPKRLQEKLKDVGTAATPSPGIQDRIFARYPSLS